MKQFLLREKPDKDGLVRLRDKDYHYLVNVRRLKPGGIFSALLPGTLLEQSTAPQLVSVTVQSIDNRTLTGSVTAVKTAGSSRGNSMPAIVLFQALPKGSKMDLIVRQAAETGISEIVPFISEHSVPQKNTGSERLSRWQRIVKEARQQSGSATATELRQVLSTAELFAYWEKIAETHKEALGLILSLPAAKEGSESARMPVPAMEGGKTISGVFAKQKLQGSESARMPIPNPLEQGGFHRYLNNKTSLIALAVGPEGGFSAAEQSRFEAAGFKAVSLGGTVLRTETAALFGAAAVRIIVMEREWWNLTRQ